MERLPAEALEVVMADIRTTESATASRNRVEHLLPWSAGVAPDFVE